MPLADTDEHRIALLNILDNRTNENARTYGDGHADALTPDEINARLGAKQAWFDRANAKAFHCAFLIKYSNQYVGYCNLGTSVNVNINGKVADEGGALFTKIEGLKDSTAKELTAEALNAVYVFYPSDLHARFGQYYPSTDFIYTISPDNSLLAAMKQSGLTQVGFGDEHTEVRQGLVHAERSEDTPRFFVDEKKQSFAEKKQRR